MRIRIGISLLRHHRWRALVSVAGVAVAVLIMQVQLAFYYAIADTQSHLASLLNADLVVVNARMNHLDQWVRIEPAQLARLRAHPLVDELLELRKDNMTLRHPRTHEALRVAVYGFPAGSDVLRLDGFAASAERLRLPGSVLFDRASRDIVGRFSEGDTIELNGKDYRVVGTVALGPNIIDDASIFMGEGTWTTTDNWQGPTMGLIRLRPGMSIAMARPSLEQVADPGLAFMTPAELEDMERQFMASNAPIGLIFGSAMVIGLLIGALVCYQILYVQILDNQREYATLRAMGMPAAYLRRDVVELGLVLGLAGLALAQPLAQLTYEWIRQGTALRVTGDPGRLALVVLLTLSGCAGAALAAWRRILAQDPSDVI